MTNTRSRTKPTRLITFEVDEDETLVMLAGRDEMDNRTIYQGQAGGRYAVVPVDDLARPAAQLDDVDVELQVDELEIVGRTATVPRSDESDVTLSVDGLEVASRTAAGVYGLLWIPAASTS